MKYSRFFRAVKQLRRLAVFLLALSLTACQAQTPKELEPTQALGERADLSSSQQSVLPTSEGNPSESPPVNRQVSGSLRLPIFSQDWQGFWDGQDPWRQSLLNLTNESLYRSDLQGRWARSLVQDAHWSQDRRQLTLTLAEGGENSADAPLQASDVAYSLQQYLNTPSVWKQQLLDLEQVDILDPGHVRLTYGQGGPYAIYGLGCPLFRTRSNPLNQNLEQGGTGSYVWSKGEGGEQLQLAPYAEQGWRIPSIKLVHFPDLAQAMRGLLEDQIDVLPLNVEAYDTYAPNQAYPIQKVPSNAFYYLHYNCEEGKKLSQLTSFAYLKRLLTHFGEGPLIASDEQDTALFKSKQLVSFSLPVLPNLLMLGDRLGEYWSRWPEQWPAQAVMGLELKLIYRQQSFDENLALELADFAQKQQIKFNLQGLAPADFEEAIRLQDYDLALAEQDLSSVPDPNWLYQPAYSGVGPSHYAWSMKVPSAGQIAAGEGQEPIDPWANAKQALLMYRLPDGIDGALYDPSWYRLVSACELYAPFTSLGCRYEGVLYGPRFQGPKAHSRDHFYRIGKENWIWSAS